MSVSGTQMTRPQPVLPNKPGRKWRAAVAGIVVVFVALAGYDLLSNGSFLASRAAAPSPSASSPARVHATATRAPSLVVRATSPSGADSASPGARPSGTPAAARELSVASAVAFGPDGTSDGDNADVASRVLTASSDGWASEWYMSPDFGGLQPGTGLLLDMGKPVSVSSVRVVLGDSAGADVQVRAGDTPVLADLATETTASGVAGTVRLALPAPVRARYVLIWFTKLPPDTTGTYQVTVYSVTVDGQP